MSLLIKQGKHDTSKDSQFEIIVETGVTAKISKMTINTKVSGAINVEMTLLDGANKGRKVFDTVGYEATSRIAWKYRDLRKAAGCPYSPSEPAQIDLDAILLNKAVRIDLFENKYKDKSTGVDKSNQGIKYLPSQNTTAASPSAAKDEDTSDAGDDDLPFNQGSCEESSSNDDPLQGW